MWEVGSWLHAENYVKQEEGQLTESERAKCGGECGGLLRFPGGSLEIESGSDKLQLVQMVTLRLQRTPKHFIQINTQVDDLNWGLNLQSRKQKSLRYVAALSHTCSIKS